MKSKKDANSYVKVDNLKSQITYQACESTKEQNLCQHFMFVFL